MSKVKLVIAEGYGSEARPYLGNEKVIDPDLKVPDTHSIIGVFRTEFDPHEDGSVQVSDDLLPLIHNQSINTLVGRLLTLTDAAFSDREQRRAFKDLVTQTTWDWYYQQTQAIVSPWRKDKSISIQ